ncbi:PAS domain-containing protein, partial [Streptomyces sp. B1866]|uniref:PAS domain-containing protein n=1 Tax=Streptomyces sp. B1866 TaxID=3075431 RepID=UPI00288F4499
MSATRGEGPREPPGPVRARRLNLLAAVAPGQGDAGVLQPALLQATAELGGYGGMAHVRVRGSTGADLRLVMSNGLPGTVTAHWAIVPERGSGALVRAVREEAFVHLHSAGAPAQPYGPAPGDPGETAVFDDVGMAAVPVPGPDGPLGTLSVLLPASRVPSPEQRAFAEEVARWAGERIRLTSLGPEGVSPNLLGGQEARRPGAEAGRNWSWDLRTGSLTYYGPVLEELGMDPALDDGRLDSWSKAIHPDDHVWVAAEADRGVRARSEWDLTYRVRRADGTYTWVQTHGRVVLDEHGEPVGAEGRTWPVGESHGALESVGRALLHMNDGFLSLSADGRVGFVNAAAERLLGPAREMVGRRLWEVPALRDVPGVAERYREAAAGGEPVSFEVPVPGRPRGPAAGPGRDRAPGGGAGPDSGQRPDGPDGEQWYHLRLVPVPDGLTAYVTDVTERRRREAERRAVEEAAARRAALMSRLTRALAEAVTARDVVDAVAASLLPPLGADGLIVATLEHERIDVVGSVGYPDAFVRRV